MSDPVDQDLVERIRRGDAAAWQECIDRYESRLLAFIDSRIRRRDVAEDVVQETFIGFLRALPNFDSQTPIESYLFTIAAHKLTDHLRRSGRRPAIPLPQQSDDSSAGSSVPQIPTRDRGASSIARGHEKEFAEKSVVIACLREQIDHCRETDSYERLKVWELLFVRGLPNRDVADLLKISEQAVANHKLFLMNKLKHAAGAIVKPQQ